MVVFMDRPFVPVKLYVCLLNIEGQFIGQDCFLERHVAERDRTQTREINIREQRKDFFGGDIAVQQVENLVKVEDRNETILDVAPRDGVPT